LMDRHGIGTDATIAQHISTVQERGYAVKDDNQRFRPSPLGIALVEGYNRSVPNRVHGILVSVFAEDKTVFNLSM